MTWNCSECAAENDDSSIRCSCGYLQLEERQETSPVSPASYDKIGGALYLVIIYLLALLIGSGAALFFSANDFMNLSGHVRNDSLWMIIASSLMFITVSIALMLLLKQNRYFPKLLGIGLIANAIAEIFLIGSDYSDGVMIQFVGYTTLILYLATSKRVKGTFVR
ncbi:hypothetical protein OR1_03498 [Geobacter sp. OR-1]|uniref:DUF2569 family protein n=1 Tax=Geobacter sp. OR-1 TaxID=1266765 RepID=UPI000543B463|nr:DUF2569 family protein [Geobacter sp. OR-1]GAM11188.1 hypothetical protein OR1_03498 [Geobacter sp. OR-1]